MLTNVYFVRALYSFLFELPALPSNSLRNSVHCGIQYQYLPDWVACLDRGILYRLFCRCTVYMIIALLDLFIYALLTEKEANSPLTQAKVWKRKTGAWKSTESTYILQLDGALCAAVSWLFLTWPSSWEGNRGTSGKWTETYNHLHCASTSMRALHRSPLPCAPVAPHSQIGFALKTCIGIETLHSCLSDLSFQFSIMSNEIIQMSIVQYKLGFCVWKSSVNIAAARIYVLHR